MSYGFDDLLKIADEAGFTPLPIGEYDVMVASAEAKTTNQGKDAIKVQFQVLSGPCAGRKIFNQFTISPENPNAVGFFFRHMEALGLPREYFAQNPSLQHIAQTLLNRQCHIKVDHREWNGQTRDNVSAITRVNTGQQVPGQDPAPAFAGSAMPQPTVPTPAPQAPPMAPPAPAVPTVPVMAPPPANGASTPVLPAAPTPTASPVAAPQAPTPPVAAPAVPPAAPAPEGSPAGTVPPELPF
jgi:hypothetical protein